MANTQGKGGMSRPDAYSDDSGQLIRRKADRVVHRIHAAPQRPGTRALPTSSPSEVINIPSFGQARAAELRGEDRKDIIVFHPGGDNSKRVEVILFE